MNSTTKNKLISLGKKAFSLIFWCFAWQIIAVFIDNTFIFPTFTQTLTALTTVVLDATFFKVVFLTLMRVIAGLVLGCFIGAILAVLSHRFEFIMALVSPIISVIKSTPVASFIVVLWVLMNGDALSIFIAFLMVMPIIWQNLLDAYNSIDNKLSEVSLVFEFSYAKRFRLLTLPALIKYFIPGLITASGLAWKAEIAAEIIAYTKNSVGQHINDAKYFMDTPTVFAWTLIVVVISIALETLTKALINLIKKYKT